jgi:hypothetical protein
MVRVMAGLTAWIAGTAIAVSVAWFGANVVLRNAGVGPGIPVVDAAVLTPPASGPSSVPAPSSASGAPRAAHSPVARPSASPGSTGPSRSTAPSASASPSSSSAGGVRDYTMAGGRVTLDVSQTSAQLVTAVPDAGYSVQTWSGTGWLRVDFSSGPAVSSLIASWYEHVPTITVEN